MTFTVRRVVLLVVIDIVSLTGCGLGRADNYEVAMDFLKKFKEIRDPRHPFSYFAYCGGELLDDFGIEALPVLIADVLINKSRNVPEERAEEIEIDVIERLLSTNCVLISAQIAAGEPPVREELPNARERLMSWFGPLLGLIPISEQEKKSIKKMVADLEKEEMIPKGVGADEIWIGGKLVSSYAMVFRAGVEQAIKQRENKDNKIHPLVLLEGKALPFLLEVIRKKEFPIKEIFIANAILLRWGCVEYAYFSLKSSMYIKPGTLPPKWVVEYDKRWFSILMRAFERVKMDIQSGMFSSQP